MLHNLFLLDMFIFNELVIQNNPIKKATSFFVFMEGVQLPHDQALVTTFQSKVFSRHYCNSQFNILTIL